jgi:hypothetical protein
MPDNFINLADRIKEVSYTMGTGDLVLSGPISGFSSFGSAYNNNDHVFYAVTDGTSYEIGSGIYLSGAEDSLTRFPFKSSNSNNLVDFPEGIKEVYVTYPATHSIYSGSGVQDYNVPQTSGLAIWASPNVLDYDANLIWDKDNNRLGLNNTSPQYAIDIGGDGSQSIIKVSGIIVGSSGIMYGNGSQTEHYEKNQLDQYAYDNELIGQLTGSSSVIELSGVANQFILFKQQNAGTVFAGPASGCTPPCSPGYPSFRVLTYEDIPAIGTVSGILNDKVFAVNSKINSVSGVLRNDLITVSGLSTGGNILLVSGILRNDLNTVSGISTNASDIGNIASGIATVASGIATSSSGILRNDLTTVSGLLGSNNISTVSGILRNDIVTVSGLIPSYIDSFTCQGRLTLQTNDPVPTGDLTSKSVVYFTPYIGNAISLYDGSKWKVVNFAQVSLTLSALSSNANYDIFGYSNGGTLTLELGPVWTDAFNRSTSLSLQDGVYCKSTDLTRRYLGTIRTTTTSTTEDSLYRRLVWNAQNRVIKKVYKESSAGPWTYGTSSWRLLNSVSTYIGVVDGLGKSTIDLTAGVLYTVSSTPSSINYYYMGISKNDGITTPLISTRIASFAATEHTQLSTRLTDFVSLGYQYYYPVEQAVNYTATLYGSNAGSYFGGIYGTWEC